MIPFFNIPNLAEIFFPKAIKANYDVRHEQAIGNRDYRNTVLSQPLEVSLTNLRQIEGRVLSRINKETDSGIDMASTTELYNIADQAISRAEISLNLATSTPSFANGIHPLYVSAKYAIEDARNALGVVVDNLPEDNQ